MIAPRFCIQLLALVLSLMLPSADSQTDHSRLQRAVDQAIQGLNGSIVLIDIESNAVLASSHLDYAGTELVRPGSTLKPFVLAELLKSGKLDARQRLLCKRPLRIGSLRLDCSHTADVTQLDADDAISYSCNSYVSEVSLRMNADELVQTFKRAGLDSPTGLIKNEVTGRIQSPTSQQRLQLAALGERGIEVTPLELLEAFRKLALGRSAGGNSPDQAVFEGLEHAVTYGTAHAAYVDGMKVAGKTGTASSAESARTHGLFVGYAPADRPQIAIVVYLPQGRGSVRLP
ncbi:MAG TPA: penicillin-binding transpeptidase domain-containing protein [Candidatus Dormibacteraeota bacterium]|nr:penicillin-binding transpeptidase domain-containing protein [Candidatus Dormibacteraeota bacterium]